MFVQVVEGKVTDAAQLRRAVEQWYEEVAPGAVGWLGSTGGVTEDGRGIAIVRFESAEAARRSSERPEQDRWWARTAPLFDGGATFRDSSDATVDTSGGDPDTAGFVQVMKGRGTDPDRARELMAQDADKWADFRPEVVGSVTVGYEDGSYTMVNYFTSEAAAREGERKEVPPELAAQMEELGKLSVGEPEFLDLKDPWMHSPR